MERALLWIGRLAGAAGTLLCLASLLARLRGIYFLGGFQVGTLLQAGIAAMVFACLTLLLALTSRPGR